MEMANMQCICYMNKLRSYININCGHITVCNNCYKKLNNICPICRTKGKYIYIIYS